MNLSQEKRFTHKAKDYTAFYNEEGEPRVNIEGIVEVAGGSLEAGGAEGSPQFHRTSILNFSETNVDASGGDVVVRKIIDMDTFKSFYVQYTLDGGVTMQLFRSGHPDANSTADGNWINVTDKVGTDPLSGGSDFSLTEDPAVPKYMLKLTFTGAADLNAYVYVTKAY